jgi:uncharacterized protein YgiM (DUF1202 family)
MPFVRILAITFLLACGSDRKKAPAIGEAFVAPASLNLRQELSPRAPVAVSLKHGDKVEIVQTRRRFVKVRTSAGAEGWTDLRQLMTTAEIKELQRLAEIAAKLPSQGKAMVYEPLNVHTDPNRQSPSFFQVNEQSRFDVLAHRLEPRTPYESEVLATPAKKTPKRVKKKRQRSRSALEVSPPSGPKPPHNWLELSKSPFPEPPPPEAPPLRYDDWYLIRANDGRAGWVLSRMVTMAIPDEVAQYAEGDRITSYFALGEVNDEHGAHRHYLWTTIDGGVQPYQFDGFRVFIFNARRHRYETAYRERNLRGYYPVEVKKVEITEGRNRLTVPSFSLIIEPQKGSFVRKTYSFQLYRVGLISTDPWKRPPAGVIDLQQPSKPSLTPEDLSLLDRLRAAFGR